MALSDKGFVDKINSCLTGNLNEIQNAQLADSIPKISSYKIDSVATFATLPAAAENTGRMVFVISEDVYYYSDGVSWTKDLTSNFSAVLYSWGRALDGQLGDGTTVAKCSPVSVIGGFTDWCQVSTTRNHIAAIRTNGTLWTWGDADQGKLGDGTTSKKSSPVSVVGRFFDWCQVSAGRNHTAAVRQNGTLWTWGEGSCGRLGDGTVANKSSPVSVIGDFTDWCQVSAGAAHAAALRTNGTLWTWGCGGVGRLGDGTTVDKCSPVSVVGGFTDWCHVSVGQFHMVALRQNGTLWSWGENGVGGDGAGGMLGDGTRTDRSSPVSVIGGFTDWCQVSAGQYHTAAVRTNGTLWTWGHGDTGRLGNGLNSDRSSPVSVIGGFTDWCQAVAGETHTAAVRQNGTLWAWGCNECGELGIGIGPPSIGDKSSPVSVIGGFTDWCQVSIGNVQTVALKFVRGF